MSSNKKAVSDVDVICDNIKKMSENGLRVGQMFSSIFDMVAADGGRDPFYVEDKAMIEYMKKYNQ